MIADALSPPALSMLLADAGLSELTTGRLLERPFTGMVSLGLDNFEIAAIVAAISRRFPGPSIQSHFDSTNDIALTELIHVFETNANGRNS